MKGRVQERMGGEKSETANLDNSFKIFSDREKRNEVIAGRESGVESIFPPSWTMIE